MTFVLLILLSKFSYAVDLTSAKEIELYQKCYIHFTRTKPPTDDTNILQIKTGKLTGVKACEELLAQADLGDDGQFIKPTDNSIKILRSFQAFHHLWFPAYELNFGTNDYTATDFYDINEMGYFVTHALFADKIKFGDILKGEQGFKAIRTTDSPPHFFYDNALAFPKEKNDQTNWVRFDNKKWKPHLVDFGALIGIKKYSGGYNFLLYNSSYEKNSEINLIEYDANKNFGGGILGTVPYILLNSGQTSGVMDGKLKDHRRWANAVINDLLCRSLPVINKQDAEKYVLPESKISFQSKVDCMQCHATIDNMAGVIRNIELVDPNLTGFEKQSVRGAYRHPIVNNSKNYYNSSTNGIVVYRDFSDKLEEKPIANLADLANWITSKDEFYYCASKRYFKFLTGYDIPFEQFKSDYKSDNDFDEQMKIFVKKEGELLSKHQAIKKLIINIISSPYF